MIKLVMRTGPQAGMEFPVDRPVVRIGRGSGNDIALQDTQASRQHAEISQQGDQFFIRDLGSTNGTFVNGEPVTAPRMLQPGDQVRIGESTMACQSAVMAAVPAVGEDWESQLWDETGVQPAAGRPKALVWVLVGLVAVLIVAAVVTAVLLLGGEEETPTPMVIAATETSPVIVEVPPTPTNTPESAAQPTVTPLIEVPTLEPVVPTVPPVEVPSLPTSAPVAPESLEDLPALVEQYFPGVSAEDLPQAIATQIQALPPEEVQAVIASLFPGATPDQLPGIIAASFPGVPQQTIQGLLGMVFPGQNIEIPEGAPLLGRLALGIYDAGRNQYDLYLSSILGGTPTLLKENATDPSFSPDSQYIVYHSLAPDTAGLRIMKVDGSDDRLLTSIASDRNPRFNPVDGQRILYSNIDNNTLHIINRDGTGRRDLGQGKYPDWSPDGQEIVYQGCVAGGRCGLIRANADGSNARQITTHPNDGMPRWKYGNIAFLSDRDGNWEIYVINDNGTWLRRITLEPATDIMACWNPEGVQLAFRSDRRGDPAVYVTSGIGGGDFKQFSAAFGSDWMLAGMDWGR